MEKTLKKLYAINLAAALDNILHSEFRLGFFGKDEEVEELGKSLLLERYPEEKGFTDHRVAVHEIPPELLLDARMARRHAERLFLATWVADQENEMLRRLKNLKRNLRGEEIIPRREVVKVAFCVAPDPMTASHLFIERFSIFDSYPGIGEVDQQLVNQAYWEIIDSLNRAIES